MTKIILYKTYREILFHKVALGYLLHIVQNGPSKSIQLWQNLFYIKCMGKSSSRKLRWVIYYTLYRMDPQKTYSHKYFCTTIYKIRKLHGPASVWEHQHNVKLLHNQFYIKYIGKSSSRKLRGVIYYTLYRMDPQKTYYNTYICTTISNTH